MRVEKSGLRPHFSRMNLEDVANYHLNLNIVLINKENSEISGYGK